MNLMERPSVLFTHPPAGYVALARLYTLLKVVSATVEHTVYLNSNSNNLNGDCYFVGWIDNNITEPTVFALDGVDVVTRIREEVGFQLVKLPQGEIDDSNKKPLATIRHTFNAAAWTKQFGFDFNDDESSVKFGTFEPCTVAVDIPTKLLARSNYKFVMASNQILPQLVVYTKIMFKGQWKQTRDLFLA